MQKRWLTRRPPCGHRWLCVAMGAYLLASSTLAAPYPVVRSQRSLALTSTSLTEARQSPQTQLHLKETPSELTPSGQGTSLQPQASPSTTLVPREAEVPPAKLVRTRELIVELKAAPTPQNAISIDLPADVLFDFDKADLRPDADSSLGKAAELVQSYATAPLTVRGHTDGKGSDEYNDALSKRRASAVAQALETRTGRKARTEGLGKREPVASNTSPDGQDNPQGRQLNRRVQILIGVPNAGR